MEITPLARRRRAAPAERVRADGERRFGDEERAVSRMFLWPTEHEVLRGAALPGIDVERRGPLFLVGYTVPPFRRWRRWQAARPFEGCLGRWLVFLALRLWAWLVQGRGCSPPGPWLWVGRWLVFLPHRLRAWFDRWLLFLSLCLWAWLVRRRGLLLARLSISLRSSSRVSISYSARLECGPLHFF